MKNWKITTAKLKSTREHILGHDWLIKITWNYARGLSTSTKVRGMSSELVNFKVIGAVAVRSWVVTETICDLGVSLHCNPHFINLACCRIKRFAGDFYCPQNHNEGAEKQK